MWPEQTVWWIWEWFGERTINWAHMEVRFDHFFSSYFFFIPLSLSLESEDDFLFVFSFFLCVKSFHSREELCRSSSSKIGFDRKTGAETFDGALRKQWVWTYPRRPRAFLEPSDRGRASLGAFSSLWMPSWREQQSSLGEWSARGLCLGVASNGPGGHGGQLARSYSFTFKFKKFLIWLPMFLDNCTNKIHRIS